MPYQTVKGAAMKKPKKPYTHEEDWKVKEQFLYIVCLPNTVNRRIIEKGTDFALTYFCSGTPSDSRLKMNLKGLGIFFLSSMGHFCALLIGCFDWEGWGEHRPRIGQSSHWLNLVKKTNIVPR
jgi:hypothetical protein